MNTNHYLEVLSKLVSFKTISSLEMDLDNSNLEILKYLENLFKEFPNVKTTISALNNNTAKPKYNLLIAIYPNNKQEDIDNSGILFSGHVDTVPIDIDNWHTDPFILTTKDNKHYGIGAVDMKGLFAYVYNAVKNIDLSKLKMPIYICATADEEITMQGAIEFIKNTKLKPLFTIVGEPSNMQPYYAHKGNFSYSVICTSDTGHSSQPLDASAIEIVYEIQTILYKIANKYKQSQYLDNNFTVPYSTLNIASIKGGTAVNRICGKVELLFDFRALPKIAKTPEEAQKINDEIKNQLKDVIIKYPNQITIKELHIPYAGFICEDSNLIKLIEDISEAKASTISYCTEAPFFAQISPTIVLGAGNIDQAHKANEFVSVDQSKLAVKIYTNLIKKICL